MNIKNMPQSERPREKMLKYGTAALSNAELIAVLIGSGSLGKSAVSVAEEILSFEASGLGFIGNCSAYDIMTVSGIGEAKACRIMAAVEIGRRLDELSVSEKDLFRTPDDIAGYFVATMRYLKEEHFRIMLLDSQGHMICVEEIGIGDVMSVCVHPREIFTGAIKRKAAAIVAAHNHPSGDCTPSGEDEELTRRIGMAGEILGIPLLEHLVIGDGRYRSIKYNT